MSKQNVIYKGKDNPIAIEAAFTGDFGDGGFNNFDNIVVDIGAESYSLISNPGNIVIVSSSELHIVIGVDTTLDDGIYSIAITGFSSTYDDGYLLTGCGLLDRVKVKEV